jgi:hypothetical protein
VERDRLAPPPPEQPPIVRDLGTFDEALRDRMLAQAAAQALPVSGEWL